MNRFNKIFTAIFVIALVSGCSSTGKKSADTMADQNMDNASSMNSSTTNNNGAETFPSGNSAAISGNNLDSGNMTSSTMDSAPFPSSNTVYYDFDSSQISDDFASLIDEHAAYLNAHPTAKVSIEGHTDERGTREYNMGLGEKRAKAVLQLLSLQGVSPSQLGMVSYGEEKPVAFGHSETSWRLNRRAEIIYTRR